MQGTYFLLNTYDNAIKIGFSTNINMRKRSLCTGASGSLVLLGWIESDKSLEKQLHKQFANCRIRQNGEWFSPILDLIEYININNEIQENWVELECDKVRLYKRMKK